MQGMTFKGNMSGFILKPLPAYLLWFILGLTLALIVGFSGSNAATTGFSLVGVANFAFSVASIMIVAWILTLQIQYLVEHTMLGDKQLIFSGSSSGLVNILFFTMFLAFMLITGIIFLAQVLNFIHPALIFIAVAIAVVAEFYVLAWAMRSLAVWFVHDVHVDSPGAPDFTFKGTTITLMQVLMIFTLVYALITGLTIALLFNFSQQVELGNIGSLMMFWLQMAMMGLLFFVVALTGPFLITQMVQYFALHTWFGDQHFFFNGKAGQLLALFFIVFGVGMILYAMFAIAMFLFSWTTLISAFIGLAAGVVQVFFSVWVMLSLYHWVIANLQLYDETINPNTSPPRTLQNITHGHG